MDRLCVSYGVTKTITPEGRFYLLEEARDMLGDEKMKLQGMHNYVSQGITDKQLGNLAGNAFNGGVVVALLISICASLTATFNWDTTAMTGVSIFDPV
jgi:hypothetical protein